MKLALKNDTAEIKNLKSLYQKEGEYAEYLRAVEYAIASAYLLNHKLNDAEVIKTIKELKNDYESGSLQNQTAKEILQNLCEAMAEAPITHHELKLVFDYVLWSIDNRSWLPDKQAYVKWITYSMGLMADDEEKKYVKYITQWGRQNGLSQKQIDGILLRNCDYEASKEEDEKSRVESEFFAMNKSEKISFLLEKGTLHFDLLTWFLFELKEEGNWKTIEKVYRGFMKRSPDFVPIYTVMYELHFEKDKALAKKYLKQGVNILKNTPNLPKGLKSKMLDEMEKELKASRSAADKLWADGSFTQSMSPEETKEKMRTFHMKHDEDMNYNCKKCRIKISAHNRDWHDGMCDDCFNAQYFPDDTPSDTAQTTIGKYSGCKNKKKLAKKQNRKAQKGLN